MMIALETWPKDYRRITNW